MSTTITPTETSVPTGTWSVDPVHSVAGFAVKHMGVATVRGQFNEFEGTLEIGDELSSARAYGTAKAASVNTNQTQRDEHLRSADFFDADLYPEISFESKAIAAIDGESFRIVGDLTLHGVTREVELLAEVSGVGLGSEDEERVGLEISGQISRREFGMKFNAALGGGNAVVADKVKLAIDIAAVKQA